MTWMVALSVLLVVSVWGNPFDKSGGWNQSKYGSYTCSLKPRCTIPRINPAVMTREKFESKYAHRPVIFVGASQNRQRRSMWSKQSLLKYFGDRVYPVFTPESLHLGLGAPKVWEMPLSNYVYMIDTKEHQKHVETSHRDLEKDTTRQKPLLHLSAWATTVDEDAASIVGDFDVYSLFAYGTNVSDRVIDIGQTDSGAPFHIHGQSWSELMYGQKRWYFYPPSKAPTQGYSHLEEHARWMESTYADLEDDDALRECVQRPGDIMYIPEGWYQASVSCGQTVSVSSHYLDAREHMLKPRLTAEHWTAYLANAVHRSEKGEDKIAIWMLKKAEKVAREADIIPLILGQLYEKLKDHINARKNYQRAYELNPRHVVTIRDYSNAIYYETDEPYRAIKIAQEALDLCPAYPTWPCIKLVDNLMLYFKNCVYGCDRSIEESLPLLKADWISRIATPPYPGITAAPSTP